MRRLELKENLGRSPIGLVERNVWGCQMRCPGVGIVGCSRIASPRLVHSLLVGCDASEPVLFVGFLAVAAVDYQLRPTTSIIEEQPVSLPRRPRPRGRLATGVERIAANKCRAAGQESSQLVDVWAAVLVRCLPRLYWISCLATPSKPSCTSSFPLAILALILHPSCQGWSRPSRNPRWCVGVIPVLLPRLYYPV
ncbi:hypothetical protein BDZ89DRAFT_1112152 [Hymenopellis radicata]|nr:hypothetical protein BDZ89DRAFT_1112152 [Hymenopellis radicata]